MKIEELRAFFAERMAEITHKDTLDSYRVRSHNAFTLLKESLEVVEGWHNANIKMFDTVSLCLEELQDAIKKDDCIVYDSCSKDVFLEELTQYIKSGKDKKESSERLCFILKSIISDNEDKYLDALFSRISDILLNSDEEIEDSQFIPILEKLDVYITPFASQLVHKGFSKIYLYKRIKSVLGDQAHSYEVILNYLRKRLCRKEPYQYHVIFKIDFTRKPKWMQEILDFVDEIPNELISEEIKTKNMNFVSPTKSSKFYIYRCEKAWDSVSAIKVAREFLSQKLDALHLSKNNIDIEIPNMAMVVENSNNGIFGQVSTEYILDGGHDLDESKVKNILKSIEDIRKKTNIDSDVKVRLNSALRHLRIGNSQKELEQRFINYWIALEFIFSSPEVSGSTFTRLKTNLTNLLTACYMKRNVLVLNRMLVKNNTIHRQQKLWEISETEFNSLIESQSSVLLKYRLVRLKAKLYGNSDKRKEYINKHERNVNYHIARIYRMRNELIHEAALKQDIENVTSNLRYYLVFLLSQMIHYYANEVNIGETLGMNQFFYTYEIRKKIICKTHALSDIMNVPLDMRLAN